MFLVLEKDVCFPEIKGLEGIFEIEGTFKLDKTPEKMRPGAIFGKERKFFKIAPKVCNFDCHRASCLARASRSPPNDTA